jgi:hypothetical protein
LAEGRRAGLDYQPFAIRLFFCLHRIARKAEDDAADHVAQHQRHLAVQPLRPFTV